MSVGLSKGYCDESDYSTSSDQNRRNDEETQNFSVKAGWFENAKYSNNKPVAGIAAVQDGGATINHPGGTPYKFGSNGEVVFVEKGTPNPAGVTKPHMIVIPPRPFMKPSVEDNKEDFIEQTRQISRKFLNVQISEKQAAEMIGMEAAGNIKKAIAKVNAPPLAAATVRRKKAVMQTEALPER